MPVIKLQQQNGCHDLQLKLHISATQNKAMVNDETRGQSSYHYLRIFHWGVYSFEPIHWWEGYIKNLLYMNMLLWNRLFQKYMTCSCLCLKTPKVRLEEHPNINQTSNDVMVWMMQGHAKSSVHFQEALLKYLTWWKKITQLTWLQYFFYFLLCPTCVQRAKKYG